MTSMVHQPLVPALATAEEKDPPQRQGLVAAHEAEEPLQRFDRGVAAHLRVQTRLDRRKMGPLQAMFDPGGRIAPDRVEAAGKCMVDVGRARAVQHGYGASVRVKGRRGPACNNAPVARLAGQPRV